MLCSLLVFAFDVFIERIRSLRLARRYTTQAVLDSSQTPGSPLLFPSQQRWCALFPVSIDQALATRTDDGISDEVPLPRLSWSPLAHRHHFCLCVGTGEGGFGW